jgi:diaminohydroxyphosphoribosylaminopyrimidine deaminase/5-amino-6-(5-phosphoribosylamino)uracil reductase
MSEKEEIIAEAWHEEFGGKHAEILALEKAIYNLKPITYNLRGATLYVNLEPCSHPGKTPPCTDAIIAAGIKTVIFGARDPIHGGAKELQKRGVDVVGPVFEAECRRLNRGFFSIIEQGRPWVTVKKALRRDGTVPSEHVTSEEQDAWTHTHLRATHDAILVGSGTILADDPQLNVRYCLTPKTYHLPPRRIILDPHGEVFSTAKVLTDEDAARTLVIREKLPIPELLERLQREGITSILVEGGPTVWKAFEESGCIDEVVYLVGK